MARQMGDKQIIGWTLRCLGDVAAFEEDVLEAQALYEENVALAWAMSNMPEIKSTLIGLAGLASTQGDNVAAQAVYEESLVLAHQTGDKRTIIYILVGAGQSCLQHRSQHSLCEPDGRK